MNLRHDERPGEQGSPHRGAFADFRVLDLTQYIAGPYATKLLADYGADVIKIERPGGEPGRQLWPLFADDAQGPESATFAYLNSNKRSIELDLKSAGDRETLLELVATADLVVESYAPGTLERLGCGLDVLRSANPNVSLISISNFGQSGPYRDWKGSDLVLYAMGGEMYSTGLADREPLKMAGTAALIQAGASASVAAAGLLFGVRRGLPPQHVDIANFETLLTSADRRHATVNAYQFTNGQVTRRPQSAGESGFVTGVLPAADGYLEMAVRASDMPRLRRLLGNPPELENPELDRPEAPTNPDFRALVDAAVFGWIYSRGKRQAWKEAQAARLLSAPLNSTKDLFEDPYFRGRGFFVEVDDGNRRYELPAGPARLQKSPWRLRRRAPRPGEHRAEILEELKQRREARA